jgi:integrase
VGGVVDKEGVIDTKSKAGRRDVPILDRLAPELDEHKLRTGRGGDDLVFGSTADKPFTPTTIRDRAVAAWKDGLAPITLHECRHTAASVRLQRKNGLRDHGALHDSDDLRLVWAPVPGRARGSRRARKRVPHAPGRRRSTLAVVT